MKKINLLLIPTTALTFLPLISCGGGGQQDPKENKYAITYTFDQFSPLTINDDVQYVEKNITWGQVTKPNVVAKTDANKNHFTYSFVNPTTEEEIKDTDVISSNTTIKVKVEFNGQVTKGDTYNSYQDVGTTFGSPKSIVPTQFYETTVKSGTLNEMVDYTFDYTVETDWSIKYFWVIKMTSGYPLTNLFTFNFPSIKVDGTELTYGASTNGYKFVRWYNGYYLEFSEAITEGQRIELKYRPLATLNSVIPVLQNE